MNITELSIRNFKSIRCLTMHNMEQALILVGKNSTGKTVVLDAILAVAIGGNSLGGGKFSLAGSVIGAYTIQALTTTLYAMHVSSDQVPVYKAIVVVIIVALQSPGFARWRKSLAQKKELSAAGKEAA